MQNASASPSPYQQFNARHDPDRDQKNTCNVATYFNLHKSYRILHIGTGDNPLPDSLPEDIDQYNKKEYPYLLAIPGDTISQYLPPGETFDKIVVVNIKNPSRRNVDYEWVFQLAATVMKSGAIIVLAAWEPAHDSIVWATSNEQVIASLGFNKVSPTAPGQYEQATADIKALPGSAWQPGTGMVSYSNANAVQVVWKKN